MLHGKHSRRFLSIAFALMLGACGSGGNSDDTGNGINADNTAPSNDDRVGGQSNSFARFDRARFENALFVVEDSSGLYGTDKFR